MFSSIGKFITELTHGLQDREDEDKRSCYRGSKKTIEKTKKAIKVVNEDDDSVEYVQYIKKNEKDISKYKALVLQGGGMRGIVFLGGLRALEKLGVMQNIEFFAGTSVGALLGLVMYLGYPVNYFINWVTRDDFIESIFGYTMEEMESFSIMKLISIGTEYGTLSTEYLQRVIMSLIARSPILGGRGTGMETFRDLYEASGKTFMCTGTCMNTSCEYYFSHDLTPDMPVCVAACISLCVPFLFKPIYYDCKYWVDGGLIQNLPVDMTKRYVKKEEILCFCIVSKKFSSSNGSLTLRQWQNPHDILNPYYERPFGAPPRTFDPLYEPFIEIRGIESYIMAFLKASQNYQSIKPDTKTSLVTFSCSMDLLSFSFNTDYATKKKYIEYSYSKAIKYLS